MIPTAVFPRWLKTDESVSSIYGTIQIPVTPSSVIDDLTPSKMGEHAGSPLHPIIRPIQIHHTLSRLNHWSRPYLFPQNIKPNDMLPVSCLVHICFVQKSILLICVICGQKK